MPVSSGFVDREDIAQRARRRDIQVYASGLADLPLEPLVELVLRADELLDRPADVVALEEDDEEQTCRCVLPL